MDNVTFVKRIGIDGVEVEHAIIDRGSIHSGYADFSTIMASAKSTVKPARLSERYISCTPIAHASNLE